MQPQAWITLAIVVAAVGLFASEKVRVDVVALVVLVTLVVLGIVTPAQALSGFSNEATVTVAAMFALSLGIERSGALDPLARLLMRIRKPWLLTLALMVAIAPMGAFVKNVALVATFLPLALRVCASTRTSPARVLMPMAYAAQMGGVCTLIGTSSNLLADSLATQHGLPPFGVFEFTRLGALLAVAGIAYLMLFGRWLLPRTIDVAVVTEQVVGKYVTELCVPEDSPLVGKSVQEAKIRSTWGVLPLELLRGDARLWSPQQQPLQAGDVLLVRGQWERLEAFRKGAKLEFQPEGRYGSTEEEAPILVEAMLKPGSELDGSTLAQLDFQRRYDAITLAIHRRGRLLRDKLRDTSLAGGDVLLVLVDERGAALLRADEHFLVLSEREDSGRTPRRAIAAIAIMVAVVVCSGLHWLPIPIAAIAGAVGMAAAGCFGRKDLYTGIDWKIIILLGAILPLGIAIDRSGLATAVVGQGMRAVGAHGPLLALLATYLLTALLTELMGHNPSVVLMIGIAVSVANSMHVHAQPFVVAVAFAAATSFATPTGYPTNTMVYYAGGYRFTDFMKAGIPLIVLFCALSMWLIPVYWPF